MKNITYLLFVVMLSTACKNGAQKETQIAHNSVFNVADLLEIASDSLDKEVQVQGVVTHVCSHSGRRCFIEDTTGAYSIKVEATGDIPSFGRELMGNTIKVTGVLQENRLSTDYINEWEVEIKEKHAHEAEDGGDKCASELANIDNMRTWMKEHNKDYYSIFYLDGTAYELVTE